MSDRKLKILLVDDEENIRHLLRMAFEGDFEVLEASDGVSALETAMNSAPDLIISDIMMPRMDGYGLYRKLKARPETASIPFVFLTAKKDVDEKVIGLEMGADDYITKPFSIKELKAKIKSLVKKVSDMQVRGSLEGLLGEVDLVEVIQLIEMGRKTGMLIIDTDEGTGNIFFKGGEPIFARAGQWEGLDGFFTMLAWRDGTFRLEQVSREIDRNIERLRGQEILMEGVRLMDEMEESIRHLPSRTAKLIYRQHRDVGDTEISRVLSCFEDGRTVTEAASVSDIPPYRFYPLVAEALTGGLLEPEATVSAEDRLALLKRARAVVESI